MHDYRRCDGCGAWTDDRFLEPILVGATPFRNVIGLKAPFCPECRAKLAGAPVMDIVQAMHAADSRMRDDAGWSPLSDGIAATVARQVGEVRDALPATDAATAELRSTFDALEAAKPFDWTYGDWHEYERIAATLNARLDSRRVRVGAGPAAVTVKARSTFAPNYANETRQQRTDRLAEMAREPDQKKYASPEAIEAAWHPVKGWSYKPLPHEDGDGWVMQVLRGTKAVGFMRRDGFIR